MSSPTHFCCSSKTANDNDGTQLAPVLQELLQRFNKLTSSEDLAHEGELVVQSLSLVETRSVEFQLRQTKSCGDLYNLEYFPLESEWKSSSVELLALQAQRGMSEGSISSSISSDSCDDYYTTTTTFFSSYTISKESVSDSCSSSSALSSSWADGCKDDSAYCLPITSIRLRNTLLPIEFQTPNESSESSDSEVSFPSLMFSMNGRFIPPFDPVKEVRKLAFRAVNMNDFLELIPEYLLSYVFSDYKMLLRQQKMLDDEKELKEPSPQEDDKCDCKLM